MPIDKGLDEISGSDPNNKNIGSGREGQLTGDLINDARGIVGPQLVDFYSSKMAGQPNDSNEISEKMKKVIRLVGINLLYIGPEVRNSSYVTISSLFYEKILNKDLDNLLVALMGDYAQNMGLLNSQQSEMSLEEITKLIPEVSLLRDNYIFRGHSRFSTVNPYIIAMGINSLAHRSLAVMAAKNGIDNENITLPEGEIKRDISLKDVTKYLQECVPLSSDFVQAAQQYGIKDITETLTRFNKAYNLYFEKWK